MSMLRFTVDDSKALALGRNECISEAGSDKPAELCFAALPRQKPFLLLSRDGHDADGPYAIIQCPQCQRAFAQSLEKNGIGLYQETRCKYCHLAIDYAVQQVRGPEAARLFERMLLLKTK